MADFVFDSFTDTAGTLLGSHTGETGATWTEHGSYAVGDPLITDANRMRTSVGSTACWYASGTPTGADYDVTATMVQRSQASSNSAGPAGRIDTGANTMYFARYLGPTGGWQLFKIVAGTATQLGSTYSQTLTADQGYECKLSMSGSTIKVAIDGVDRITPSADTAITDAGKAGFRAAGAIANTTGLHFDALVATEAGGGGTTYSETATAALALASDQSALGTFGGTATAVLGLSSAQSALGTFPSVVSDAFALATAQIGGLVLEGTVEDALALETTQEAIKAVFGEVTDSLVWSTTQAGRVDFSATVTAGLGLATVLGTIANHLLTVSASITLTSSAAGALETAQVEGAALYTFVAGPITMSFRVEEVPVNFIAAPRERFN